MLTILHHAHYNSHLATTSILSPRVDAATGPQFAQLPADKARQLGGLFSFSSRLIAQSSAEGWLLRMTFAPSGAGPDAFAKTHSAIQDIVLVCACDC
jgi:hypothetical protein